MVRHSSSCCHDPGGGGGGGQQQQQQPPQHPQHQQEDRCCFSSVVIYKWKKAGRQVHTIITKKLTNLLYLLFVFHYHFFGSINIHGYRLCHSSLSYYPILYSSCVLLFFKYWIDITTTYICLYRMVSIVHPSLSFLLSVPYGRRTGSATIISNNDMDMDIDMDIDHVLLLFYFVEVYFR